MALVLLPEGEGEFGADSLLPLEVPAALVAES